MPKNSSYISSDSDLPFPFSMDGYEEESSSVNKSLPVVPESDEQPTVEKLHSFSHKIRKVREFPKIGNSNTLSPQVSLTSVLSESLLSNCFKPSPTSIAQNTSSSRQVSQVSTLTEALRNSLPLELSFVDAESIENTAPPNHTSIPFPHIGGTPIQKNAETAYSTSQRQKTSSLNSTPTPNRDALKQNLQNVLSSKILYEDDVNNTPKTKNFEGFSQLEGDVSKRLQRLQLLLNPQRNCKTAAWHFFLSALGYKAYIMKENAKIQEKYTLIQSKWNTFKKTQNNDNLHQLKLALKYERNLSLFGATSYRKTKSAYKAMEKQLNAPAPGRV